MKGRKLPLKFNRNVLFIHALDYQYFFEGKAGVRGLDREWEERTGEEWLNIKESKMKEFEGTY